MLGIPLDFDPKKKQGFLTSFGMTAFLGFSSKAISAFFQQALGYGAP